LLDSLLQEIINYKFSEFKISLKSHGESTQTSL